MQSSVGGASPITGPIKIPDSGTPGQIINRRRGSGDDTDEVRIPNSAAEPSSMKKKLLPPSKPTSQSRMTAAPIPSAQQPATIAREKANLTLEQAAKALRVKPRYLRDIERKGQAPYVFAERAALLYGCPVLTFLFAPSPQRVTGTPESHPVSRTKQPGQNVAATAGQSKRVRYRYPTLTLIKGG